MAGTAIKRLVFICLLSGLPAAAALAETGSICDFKRQAASKLHGGSGVYALFSGPQGTGKTIAAKVLAAELGMDLYRVDLSRVVGKYVGETEKNLDQLFAKAENDNLVLYFDEADALFGKRTDVKDANDRYANLDTAHLLSRIENHAGVVILATNRPPAAVPRTRKRPVTVNFKPGQPHPREQLGKCK